MPKRYKNSQKQWESLLQPIQRALDTSITGIIVGTTTVQKALVESRAVDYRRIRRAQRSAACSTVWGKCSAEALPAGVAEAAAIRISRRRHRRRRGPSGGGIQQGLFGSGGLSGAWALALFRAVAFWQPVQRNRVCVQLQARRDSAIGSGGLDGPVNIVSDVARE